MSKNKKRLISISSVIIVIIAILPIVLNQESEEINAETRTNAHGQFIELTHGFVHYEQAGPDSAQTVLLVHGFSCPSYIWDSTFYTLAKNGFNVIRFDLYGRGYSDRPDVKYDKKLFEHQILDLITELKIDDPIDIVGLSMGGPLSTEFTVNHPEKINKVVLIDPFHEAMNISILQVPLLGEYLINVYLGPTIANKTIGDFYNPEPHQDWPSRFKVQMQYKGFKNAILSTLRFYVVEDKLNAYTQLGKLNKPVMLVWGKEDATLPYAGNERIQQVVDCEFLSVENAGHIPHIEKSEIVNPKLIEFLKSE